MASDQIHHQLHSNPQAMFPDHEHDLNGFNTLFSNSAADPAYDSPWTLESANPQSVSVPQAWHSQAATARPHALPAVNSPYNVPNQFYGQSLPNNSASFQQSFSNHGNLHGFPEPALDPALVAASPPDRSNFNNTVPGYSTTVRQAGTIAPSALQTVQPMKANSQTTTPVTVGASSYPAPQSAHGQSNPFGFTQFPATAPSSLPLARSNFPKMPDSVVSGMFLIVDFEELSQTTNSRRLATFLNIGEVPQDISSNRTTIPSFQRRKSRNEIQKLAAGDEKLLEKIARKPKKLKSVEIKVRRPAKAPGDVKEGVSDTSSDSSSEDDSDYDSSDDEVPEISPLPKIRPDRPIDAVKYDTIKAVWLPRRTTAQASQIRNGLMEFWEVVRTIRDRWKADSTTVKEAEEAKRVSELPLLRDRVRAQREMVETALKTAKEHGHPEIIRLLGEHVSFVFVMYQFLAERVRELDYKSSLPQIIIEFLSLTTSASNETLEKTKLNKVLTLFGKRGDEQTQAHIKQILENAAKASKSKASPPAQSKPKEEAEKERDAKVKGSEIKDPANKTEPLKRPNGDLVAGVKRPRPNDANAVQAAKRIASISSPTKPTLDVKSASVVQKRPLPITAEKGAPNITVKQKVVSKPTTSLFSGLQSASKKPTVVKPASMQQKVLPTASEKKTAATPSAPPKSSFSFADTMANLLKPKEPEPTAKLEEKRPPETEEERSKRLRKEERRKLHVHFKPDISLVSIRYFTHDPEEEMGHDASMVRDAGDVHGEGRMFKQHKDMMDMDDDEEDLPSEETFKEWFVPSSVDFSEVDLEERKRNYEPYGGGMLKPSCPEKEVQERREASILMVFYSHSSDIPPSPKEPGGDDSEHSKSPVQFGTPGEPTASRAAPYVPKQPASHTVPQQSPASSSDVASLLSMLVPSTQQQPQQQSALPQANAPGSNGFDALEKLFGSVNVAPQPVATPPIAPIQQPPPQQNNLNAILASLQQFQTNSQKQQHQQQQQPAPPVAAPWAAMQGQTAAMPNADQLIATLQQYGMPTIQGLNYGNVQATTQKQTSGPYEDPERKRLRDEPSEQGQGAHHKRRKWHDSGEQGSKNPNPPKYVVPCRFWKEGKCKKGSECTYLHT